MSLPRRIPVESAEPVRILHKRDRLEALEKSVESLCKRVEKQEMRIGWLEKSVKALEKKGK